MLQDRHAGDTLSEIKSATPTARCAKPAHGAPGAGGAVFAAVVVCRLGYEPADRWRDALDRQQEAMAPLA